MHFVLGHVLPVFVLIQLSLTLRIASSLAWIEHTPLPYAIQHFYNGSTPATLVSGSVADLASNPKDFDLAASAETQGLKQYANHRNLRVIYVICEVAYRIVADKRKGITQLSDLKGKKIGTIPNSSASVFIHNMMTSVGIQDDEYTTVSGNICMKTPCASDTLPAQLQAGTIDAFGVREPAVELGVEALGANAITFQNATVYQEAYLLYSTNDALYDTARRRDIVDYVRALNKTFDVFKNKPRESGVYDFVSKAVGVDEPVVEKVWPDHEWTGRWGDIIEFIAEEDRYLASQDKRAVTPRSELAFFFNPSVFMEL